MAFILEPADGLWGMGFGIFPFLKEPDTGRKQIARDIAFRGIPP